MNFILQKTLAFFTLGLLVTGCGPGARKGYHIENGQVALYTGFPAQRRVIGEADATSFRSLNDEYGKDNQHVFYLGKRIPNADPATFEYLAGCYSKDKINGYAGEHRISTDGPTFGIVPNPNETPGNQTSEGIAYARDAHRVYKYMLPIEGADPATFALVPMFNGTYLTHDHRRVWFQDVPMVGVNGATFRKVTDFHFKDNQRVWGLSLGREVRWVPVAGADAASFTRIGTSYARDTRRVYFGPDSVKAADPATFAETGYLAGKDKHGTYRSGYRATDKK